MNKKQYVKDLSDQAYLLDGEMSYLAYDFMRSHEDPNLTFAGAASQRRSIRKYYNLKEERDRLNMILLHIYEGMDPVIAKLTYG
jgi:hypothetical protein